MFTVMVIGDNPQEIINKYKIGPCDKKKIKYRYLDASKMKENNITILKQILSGPNKLSLNQFQIDCFKEKLSDLKNMSTLDYYAELTKGLEIDDEGNAWSDENPQGKWITARVGRNLSLPLILKDGTETQEALKGDVDWGQMHMGNTRLYSKVWELVKGEDKPENEEEKQIYENMKDKDEYFSHFKDKMEYITHNCAYWNYAVADSKGWIDIDSSETSDMEWIRNFFDRFVAPLNDDTKITIYECSKQ